MVFSSSFDWDILAAASVSDGCSQTSIAPATRSTDVRSENARPASISATSSP